MEPKTIPTPLFLPKGLWPKELQHPKVKGIAIDACVNPINRSPILDDGKALAHAHCHPFDDYRGWICYKSDKYLRRATNLHELAHLIVGTKAGHGYEWYEKYVELGSTSLYNRIVVFFDLLFRLPDPAAKKWSIGLAWRMCLFVIMPALFNAPSLLSIMCLVLGLWSSFVSAKNIIGLEYSKCVSQ